MAMRRKALAAALKGSESKVVGTPTNKKTMAISGYINGLILKKIQETNFDSFQSKYGVSSFPKSGILYCLVNIF